MQNLNYEQMARIAFKEAESLRLQRGISRTDPIDPIDLAIDCGCDVRFSDTNSLEGIYATKPRPCIILGSRRPSGRIAFTCGHELGHHVFKHGTSFDNVSDGISNRSEERLADLFAGYLLMSPLVVRRAMKERGIQEGSITAFQIWQLASYFGVGYKTVIDHLEYSLRLLLPLMSGDLRKVHPKDIKNQYGCPAGNNFIFVDKQWTKRAITLECGDHIMLPFKTCHESNLLTQKRYSEENTSTLIEAIAPGYCRLFDPDSDWAANVRVSRKNYEGLAQYRFLEE